MNTKFEQMAVLTAMFLSGKNWHLLDAKQQQVVKLLEELGYIIPNNPSNGFVGSFCETKTAHLPGDQVVLSEASGHVEVDDSEHIPGFANIAESNVGAFEDFVIGLAE